MATRTVFSDEDNNEMDCYINDKGKVYISVGQSGDDVMHFGWITLDKEDTQSLIKILSDIVKEMD
jgi:hypothetical protein